ncbi:MAG: TolC family protein [Planctomycetota bacterium]|nr:TolC family protein [Planctomycetota bacterium]
MASILACTGCSGPMAGTSDTELRDQVIASHRAFIKAASAGPVIEVVRAPSNLEAKLSPERRAQLDIISGPPSYAADKLDLGPDLMGNVSRDNVSMSLQRAIELATRNNLDVQFAKLVPAVGTTQVTQAEAAFDAVFFTSFEWQNLDTPKPLPLPFNTFSGNTQVNNYTLGTGIRKPLSTGGQITVQTDIGRQFANPSPYVDPGFQTSDVLLTLRQPLLRKFGSDIAKSDIALAKSAREQAVADLRRQLLETIVNAERSYWQLVFAHQRLLIQLRLYKRTHEDYAQLEPRAGFDVSPVRLTEAGSFLETRRGAVISARQDVRVASDRLKRLINAPELPLTGETLIVPVEMPADIPVSFSLLDAVTTAISKRPELRRALLQIEDAAVRQRVADNGRLPMLDIEGTLRYNGVGDSVGDSVYNMRSGRFMDYILRAQFEVPIGNRGPEAQYRQRQIERRASVVNYQRTAQDVVLDVKESLRQIQTNYELIAASRSARRAAADNLRAIDEQEKAGAPLTPEFLLDLKLTTEERLANSESQEMQSLTEYNSAIAKFYQSIGTLLERNGIEFRDPEDTTDRK